LRDPQDGTAWREFVDLYLPLVYGYVRKQGLQDADAADLSQEVLQAVASAIGRLDYDPRRGRSATGCSPSFATSCPTGGGRSPPGGGRPGRGLSPRIPPRTAPPASPPMPQPTPFSPVPPAAPPPPPGAMASHRTPPPSQAFSLPPRHDDVSQNLTVSSLL